MKHTLWLLRWILKAAIFFTLFAFALNNQQEASVNLFFGLNWRAPLVLIVLAVFTIGIIVGVLAMVPRWWRVRKIARGPRGAHTPRSDSTAQSSTFSKSTGTEESVSLGSQKRSDLVKPLQSNTTSRADYASPAPSSPATSTVRDSRVHGS